MTTNQTTHIIDLQKQKIDFQKHEIDNQFKAIMNKISLAKSTNNEVLSPPQEFTFEVDLYTQYLNQLIEHKKKILALQKEFEILNDEIISKKNLR